MINYEFSVYENVVLSYSIHKKLGYLGTGIISTAGFIDRDTNEITNIPFSADDIECYFRTIKPDLPDEELKLLARDFNFEKKENVPNAIKIIMDFYIKHGKRYVKSNRGKSTFINHAKKYIKEKFWFLSLFSKDKS